MTGRMFIAPAGTSLLDAGWEPLGHTSLDNLTITPAYSAIHLTDAMAELYLAFPQRFIVGLPPEEDPLEPTFSMKTRVPSTRVEVTSPNNGTVSLSIRRGIIDNADASLNTEQMAMLASTLLKRVRPVTVGKSTVDGRQSVSVGKGIVYSAQNEPEAQRNLDFALANLTAYLDWEQYGREEARRREENLRKAEELKAAQDRREADLKASQERLRATRLKNGLDLYNKVNSARYMSWPTFITMTARELWSKQAEEVAALTRQSNPYSSSIFASGGFVDGSITARSSSYFNSF